MCVLQGNTKKRGTRGKKNLERKTERKGRQKGNLRGDNRIREKRAKVYREKEERNEKKTRNERRGSRLKLRKCNPNSNQHPKKSLSYKNLAKKKLTAL